MINSMFNACIILGDFSVNTLSNVRSANGIDFTEIFSCLDYDSLDNIPTRRTSSTAICIDHIYMKFTACNKSGILDKNISDHVA